MFISTCPDRFPTLPCAILLGLDIVEANQADGTVKIAFTARPEFRHAAGNVQGGILIAMLDDCMGPAILIATEAMARIRITAFQKAVAWHFSPRCFAVP